PGTGEFERGVSAELRVAVITHARCERELIEQRRLELAEAARRASRALFQCGGIIAEAFARIGVALAFRAEGDLVVVIQIERALIFHPRRSALAAERLSVQEWEGWREVEFAEQCPVGARADDSKPVVETSVEQIGVESGIARHQRILVVLRGVS